MSLVWYHDLAICWTRSLHFTLINMPISKANSRFYNWQVQRIRPTRSQGELIQQNIIVASKEKFNYTSTHTLNDTFTNTSKHMFNVTSKDTNKRYIKTCIKCDMK